MIEVKNNFPNFSPELLQQIATHATIHKFKAGDIIMRNGQYIKSTALVTKGKIKIYREDNEGNEFFMYYLLPGQACAISMTCATTAQTSQITAKAEENGELVMVPLHLMDKWMSEHKSWYEFVIETYRSRFEEVLAVVDQIAFRSMDERLVFYLQRHAKANAVKILQISHQQIATDLSSSREVISRLLKKMEQRGLVKLNRNNIELLK
jgi:CRP/FNR family transcriptional regulator